jgi:AraC-like DNA-binding protein
MKEIAYNLGFDNLAHFSKFLRNNCGMNFTDYKKGLHLFDQNKLT